MIAIGGCLIGRRRGQNRLRLIFVQRGTAFSAKIVGGPELDQMTVVTSNHFPGVYRCQCCCHEMISECQSKAKLQKSNYLGPLTDVVSSKNSHLSTGNLGKNLN